MPEEIELTSGKTAVARITKNLTYRVTHDGWTLRVESTQPLGVKPNSDGSVNIISLGISEDDEV